MITRYTMTALLVMLTFGIDAQALEEIEQTLDMPEDGLVQVENMAGEIDIETWDRAQAWVNVEPGRKVESVDIEPTANGIRVVVHYPNNTRRIDESRVSLKVPERASLEVRAVSADIEVDGSKGEVIDLESVSGDVSAEAEVTTARLKTVSGDAGFSGSASRSSVESVSGDVALEGVDGEIRATTVSGDVYVEAGQVSRCTVETVSGDAGVELALTDDGRLEARTMSGDLTLRLPSGQAGSFTAQTYSGTISTDIGSASRSKSGGGARLEHREGANGARINAESFSGDISIRTR